MENGYNYENINCDMTKMKMSIHFTWISIMNGEWHLDLVDPRSKIQDPSVAFTWIHNTKTLFIESIFDFIMKYKTKRKNKQHTIDISC